MNWYMKRYLLLLIPLLVSCGSARYASRGFKTADVQEYAFLKPCAHLVRYDTDGGYYHQGNTDIHTGIIVNLINAERFPFSEMIEADYQGEDKETLTWARNLEDIKQSQVERLRVPKALLKRLEGVPNRYGILIFSRGYNMTQDAYDKERREKAASKLIDRTAEKLTGISGLTNPTQNYTPSDPYGNLMICVVVDKQQQRVVYYAQQTPTFASDPKDNADVSGLLHALLKDFIY